MEKQIKVNLNQITSIKKFASAAYKQEFDIDVVSGKYIINAKSILGLFSLDLSKDVTIRMSCSEEEAKEFIDEIKDLIVG